MYVNGKKVVKYDLDTENSIKNRICLINKTIPSHVYIEISFDKEKNINIYSTTLEEVIKTEKYTLHDFVNFYEKYREKFNELKLKDFASEWYILKFNSSLRTDPYATIKMDEYLQEKNLSIDEIERDIDDYKKKIKYEYSSFIQRVERDERLFRDFELKTPLSTTNLEVIKIKTQISFEVDYDIYELFNTVTLSRDIPFLVIGDYYKILKDFVPSNNWTYAREKLIGDFSDKRDVLYVKVLNVRNEPLKNVEQTNSNYYTTVSIYFETLQEEKERKMMEKQLEEKRIQEQRERREELEKKEQESKKSQQQVKRKKRGGEQSVQEEEKQQRYEQKKNEEREEEEKQQQEQKEEDSDEEIPVVSNKSKVFIRVESSTESDFTESDLISRVLSIFPKKIDIIEKKKIQIKAEFLVPSVNIERPIFLDMILNDPIVSRMCYVDERLRLQREKGGIYIYFLPPDEKEENIVTVSMTEQIVEKTNIKLMAKHPLLKVDIPYIRVRITKAVNEEMALNFQKIFSRIVSLYRDERDTISRKYSQYIGDFEKIIQEMKRDIETKRRKSTRLKKLLKDVNPEQFIPGYSRICQANRAPRIIAEKKNPDDPEPPEVTEIENKGHQVMLFPKDTSEGKQFYYACEHNKTNKFPALRQNKLSNFEEYPIVPCCYKKDHRTKPNSLWKKYYEQDKKFQDFKEKVNDRDEKEEDDKHVFITNKILKPGRRGVLPKNIDEYFKSIDVSEEYFRKGVSRSYSSVLEVLLYVVDENFEEMTSEQRMDRVIELRRQLVDSVEISDMFQQAYNYTPELIKDFLKDENKYLDPKIFIHLLEEYFKCYIFIFSRNEKNPYGTLDCPQNVKMYLQNKKRRRKHIFIYEHSGSEIDKAEYPQCELIFSVKDNEEKLVFSGEVVERTENVFKEMYLQRSEDYSIELSFKTKVIQQELDYQGKLRILQFDNGICVMTNPLPPLRVPQKKCSYKSVPIQDAQSFLRYEGISIETTKDHIVSGRQVGIHASKDGVDFYIPIVHIEKDFDNEIDVITPIMDTDRSELESYNDYSRRARYLIEYMYYLFSLDYQTYNPEKIDSEYILSFVDRNIEINSEFQYGDVPRMFSLDSGLLQDNKLVVQNTFTLKKLLYCLRLKLRDNSEELKKYSEYKYIKEYYKDIRDFSSTDTQPILYGKDSLKKWIDNIKPNYTLYESIKLQESSLYKELSKYDNDKPFMLVFTAKWHRPCKNLLSKLSPTISGDKRDLFRLYGKRIHFVYIDIEENKSIVTNYDINSIPFILFLKISAAKLVEIGRIVGTDNTNQNLKMIETKISEILKI